jgi:hypothetical protein
MAWMIPGLTIGMVSRVLTPLPFVVIFITLIYGTTLPGAGKGLKAWGLTLVHVRAQLEQLRDTLLS